MEATALKIISLHLGLVVDSEALLAEWQKPMGVRRVAQGARG
jgi:hypothetical protein